MQSEEFPQYCEVKLIKEKHGFKKDTLGTLVEVFENPPGALMEVHLIEDGQPDFRVIPVYFDEIERV